MTVTKTWNIEILLTETDDMTHAHAVLQPDQAAWLRRRDAAAATREARSYRR